MDTPPTESNDAWVDEVAPIAKGVFGKIEGPLTGEPAGHYPEQFLMHKKWVKSMLTKLANPDYLSLALVLTEAYDEASAGKGRERHAYGEPFEEQDIVTEAVTLGLAAPAFQARKKIKEALRLFERHGSARAIPDLLGAINYAAAIIIAMRQIENGSQKIKEATHDADI
jgi:hypothetical protein